MLSLRFFETATFDESGAADYLDVVEAAEGNFDRLNIAAGARLPKGLSDASARTGYSLTGSQPSTPHEMAAEYFFVSVLNFNCALSLIL